MAEKSQFHKDLDERVIRAGEETDRRVPRPTQEEADAFKTQQLDPVEVPVKAEASEGPAQEFHDATIESNRRALEAASVGTYETRTEAPRRGRPPKEDRKAD